MAGTDIFISYSREDRRHARNVAACLECEGFNVWWDAALHSGDTFDMVIEHHLNEAKAVVVLWSPRSVKSRWVRAEATLADKRGKLAPVIIEECERPIIFELMHTVDLSHWEGDPTDPVWSLFMDDLRRTTGTPPPAELSPPAPPLPLPPVEAGPSAFPAFGQPVDEDADEAYEATQFYTSNSSPVMATHRLEMLVDGEVAQSFEVGPLGLRIGRSDPAEIVLADKRVSRRHCVIEIEGDEMFVIDLGSTNGTFVDGERVTDRAVIPSGSVLRVGGFDFVHEIVAAARA